MKRFTRMLSGFLALALTCSAVLTGCGGTPSSGTPDAGSQGTSSAATGEKTTLKWAMWDLDNEPYFKALADAYMEKNPNVEVELVNLDNSNYTVALSTQLAGGSSEIDVMALKDIPSYSNLVSLGLLEPLNDRLTTDPAEYNGTIEQISTEDGKYYAAPFRSDFWLVYYNKDLFDAANVEYPTNDMTFEEYADLAYKMTSGSGNEKVYGAHFHTWRSTVQLFGILDGKHTVLDGSYDFLKPYYETVLKMQQDGVCQDYATLKTSQTHYSGPFYNENVAMLNMGSWFIATLMNKTASGENLAENWGIVKYPHPEGVPAGTTLGTATLLGVNSSSTKKDAAIDLLNFVCGSEGAKIVASCGKIPALMTDDVVTMISEMEGFPTDENSREALKTTKKYLEMPMHAQSGDIDKALSDGHDSIMTENISIEDGIAQMTSEVSTILGK